MGTNSGVDVKLLVVLWLFLFHVVLSVSVAISASDLPCILKQLLIYVWPCRTLTRYQGLGFALVEGRNPPQNRKNALKTWVRSTPP